MAPLSTCPTCTGPVLLVPDEDGMACPQCSVRFGARPIAVASDAVTLSGAMPGDPVASRRRDRDEVPKNPFSKDFMSRFEMVGFLGKGAMGAVFLMRQLNLDRLVAVKAVRGQGLTDKENKRLIKEARVIARLNHPNIRAIHDVGTDDRLPYMICEYVDGQPLSTRLKSEGALGLAEALRLALAILEGLDFAHQQGVVHRDLKPGNILLNKDGRPKLVDFGLATIPNMSSLESIAGRILGTPRYMSPEQCRGEESTASSDLYAMGITLFEMLTGQLPYDGPGPMNYMDQHLHAAPKAVTEVRPELPAALDRIVARVLAKQAAERYSSAAELGEELMEIYAGLTSVRFASRSPRSEPSPRVPVPGLVASAGTLLIERYKLVRPLGRGRLGEVWLALDQALDDSEVAVRLVDDAVWSDLAVRAALVREAKFALKLAHPNIVRLINLEPGTPAFFVSEFVEGPSLAAELTRREREKARAFSPVELLPLVESIAAGLEYAHARGVQHRALSPANIVLERGDAGVVAVRITDFGIAAALAVPVSGTTGAAPYRAPEQRAGGAVDARADVYALAATTYHMLALVPPLPTDRERAGPGPAPELLPPAIAPVVMRALNRDAGARPPTPTAFVDALRDAVQMVAEASPAPSRADSSGGSSGDSSGGTSGDSSGGSPWSRSAEWQLPRPDVTDRVQGLTRLHLFQLVCDEVFKDGVVEEWENRALVALTEYLQIASDEARGVAWLARQKFLAGRLGSRRPLDPRTLYSKALYFAYVDGPPNDEREHLLAGVRRLFSITPEDHAELLERVKAKLG